ncbi:MAG: DNA-processing protein DprA [Proteobacteria bacterium]|nr:DNA-processing protein DprA [Pseudomonadota bacterium]
METQHREDSLRHLEDYLRLFHCRELPVARFSALLSQFGNLTRIRSHSTLEMADWGLTPEQVRVLAEPKYAKDVANFVDRDLNWRETATNSIVCYEDNAYPELLRQTAGAPALLYVRGRIKSLTEPLFAIVGSRKSSSYGLRIAYWMAHELGRIGLGICSGLAKGIDAQSHAGALAADAGTIAVMGTGADIIYPAANRQLAERILQNGALVTEFPLGTQPLPAHFPQRNRIISGLSSGVLVVEATTRSGSLITARLALDQNRDVFAIPGAVSSPVSRGCHQLIKQGAKLVETPEDILEELTLLNPSLPADSSAGYEPLCDPPLEKAIGNNAQRRLILKALQAESCLLETLLERTGLDLQPLNNELVQLEVEGHIESIGGRYARVFQTPLHRVTD